MNPFFREKRNCYLPVLILFLLITGLIPVFADDYGRPVGAGSINELEKDALNQQPSQRPDQLSQKPDQPTQQPDQLSQKQDKPTQQPDQLGKPGHKPDQFGKPGQQPDQLGKPGQKPDHLNKPNSPDKVSRAGDIKLQIVNDTDFALFVRASILDASERVNLAKAQSISLSAHAQESVILTPMNAGKVSLAPMSSKAEISQDSKILLTINKGKETRRLVLGYAKSAGVIVLGKDLFPQTHESSHRPKSPFPDDALEKSEKGDKGKSLEHQSTASIKAQTIYVINQTENSVSYNALLKPANFEPLQGELKPGTNVLKFPAKKASGSLSQGKLNLILQMKYNSPGSPMVALNKDAFDLDSQPTVIVTKTVMGEPAGKPLPPKGSKKLK